MEISLFHHIKFPDLIKLMMLVKMIDLQSLRILCETLKSNY